MKVMQLPFNPLHWHKKALTEECIGIKSIGDMKIKLWQFLFNKLATPKVY